MTAEVVLELPSENDTLELGRALSGLLTPPAVIYLEGQLGAGKTTLSRAILRGMGHSGSVKSPTYTLVEPYELADKMVYHFDLYRLSDPEELEFLGIRDYFQDNSLCLIEWAEKGSGLLPGPDLAITLGVSGKGRQARLQAYTDSMKQVIGRATRIFSQDHQQNGAEGY